MGLFDKVKTVANQAKDNVVKFAEEKQITDKLEKATEGIKKTINETSATIKANNEEAKELKKPLEGAIIRYEFTYVSGLDDIPKAKVGAWGLNIMEDRFSFRVTSTTKDWLYDMDIEYDNVTDIRIEKRTISTTEMLLGAGNDANQQQENVIVIDYNNDSGRKNTLRVEMLTGVTIYNQAAKCKELMDLLKNNNILDKIKPNNVSSNSKETQILDNIEKLAKLKESGILSEEEYVAKKTELLSKL